MSGDGSALKLWHTARHLRWRQIFGQLRQRLPGAPPRADRLLDRRARAFPGCRFRLRAEPLRPGPQAPPSGGSRGSLSFLNRTEPIGWPPDWGRSDLPKLWLYNLHYFDWLWELNYADARFAVLDWIEHHPPGQHQVGWEPYPTSLRLMNWSMFFFGTARREIEQDAELARELWVSAAVQAEWLTRRLEFHLLGNHLLENAAALALAGSCFRGERPESWYRRGCRLLEQELAEQVLPDGMHFERSPMYHLRVCYVLTLLLTLGRPNLDRLVRSPLARMLTALPRLCHPDREIALFNDSALGVYNAPEQLLRAAGGLLESPPERAAEGAWSLPDAGYFGYRGGDGSYIICDAGPVGPDYLPGHAHGDIFSFELSLRGHRVIVDTGVHDYESGPMRRYCRSTRAHNTVEIDGEDQCEFWGAFRVARRGRPRDVDWRPSSAGFELRGWHDGYRRLAGSPRHQRKVVWHATQGLKLWDTVEASRDVTSRSRLHLHPACRISDLSASQAEISFPAGRLRIVFSGEGRLSREDSIYCPRFGSQEPNETLVFTADGSRSETGMRLEWEAG